jgi:hypothetical protein
MVAEQATLQTKSGSLRRAALYPKANCTQSTITAQIICKPSRTRLKATFDYSYKFCTAWFYLLGNYKHGDDATLSVLLRTILSET